MADGWANSMACHPRATCHIAQCKNSIRHIENGFSPYFIFWFLMQFRLWRAAAFVSSPIHLFICLFFYYHVYGETNLCKINSNVNLMWDMCGHFSVCRRRKRDETKTKSEVNGSSDTPNVANEYVAEDTRTDPHRSNYEYIPATGDVNPGTVSSPPSHYEHLRLGPIAPVTAGHEYEQLQAEPWITDIRRNCNCILCRFALETKEIRN